jgi:hypothetical protein
MHLFQRLFAAAYDPVMSPLEHGRLGERRRELLAGSRRRARRRRRHRREPRAPPGSRSAASSPSSRTRRWCGGCTIGPRPPAEPDIEVVDAEAEALPLPDANCVDVA